MSEPWLGELRQSLREVQGALIELLAAHAAGSSRAVADRLGLSKNLVWRARRVISARSSTEIHKHLPGHAAFESLLASLAKSGSASEADIRAARDAMLRLNGIVDEHAGDRTTLDVILSGRPDHTDEERQEAARKLAFQGNGSIYGVQTRLRLGLFVVSPSAGLDDGTIDMANVGGYVDLRRLRANTPWPLFHLRPFNDNGTARAADWEAIDSVSSPIPLPFLTGFCSAPLPEIRTVELPDEIEYELCPGSVGKTGDETVIFGRVTRRFASIHRDEHNEFGEHVLHLNTPAEALVLDVLLHESLPLPVAPEIALYSQLMYRAEYPAGGRDRCQLLVTDRVVDLGEGSPVVATHLLPRYPALVRHVLDRLDWRLDAYRGYRFTMRYPPIPAIAVMRYPLAEPR